MHRSKKENLTTKSKNSFEFTQDIFQRENENLLKAAKFFSSAQTFRQQWHKIHEEKYKIAIYFVLSILFNVFHLIRKHKLFAIDIEVFYFQW